MPVLGWTQPASSNGVNLVDSIDQMDPSYALELINIIPGAQTPKLRKGYISNCSTGASNQIGTLTGLPLTDGTSKLTATDASKIWEVSTTSASNITGVTVPTSANWNTTNFANRTYFCNGADTVQVYTGTGSCADSNFSGVTLANLINVSSYKERLYFVEKNTLKFWYGNTQAVGGSALTAYDLQYTFKRGGRLLFAGSWTNQLATTSADLFFACSSQGEILFYSGSYPGDAAWTLVARFVIGKPMSYRSFVRVDNDVWIITEQGVVPISALFQVGASHALDTVGDKINPLLSYYASNIGFSHLWHGIHNPIDALVYIVIPMGGSSSIFAVYSTDKNSWTNYEFNQTGDGLALAMLNSSPYWGSSNGTIFKGEYGYNDNGAAISYSGRTAFTFGGQRNQYKTFKDIRPLLKAPPSIEMQIGLDTDFRRQAELDTITLPSGTFTPYGSLYGSLYSSDAEYVYQRYSTRGQGHSFAIRYSGTVLDSSLEIYGFEVRYDGGGQV